MKDLGWQDGQLFPKNHLGQVVNISPFQFYSLENVIQKVKGAAQVVLLQVVSLHIVK